MADLWTQKLDASVETISNASESDARKAFSETDWKVLWSGVDLETSEVDCRPGVGVTTEDTFHTLYMSKHPDEEKVMARFHYPKTKKVMLVPVTYGGVIEKSISPEPMSQWLSWFFSGEFERIQKALEAL